MATLYRQAWRFVEFACDGHWGVFVSHRLVCRKCGRQIVQGASKVLPFARRAA
jgi:hypothetical protein